MLFGISACYPYRTPDARTSESGVVPAHARQQVLCYNGIGPWGSHEVVQKLVDQMGQNNFEVYSFYSFILFILFILLFFYYFILLFRLLLTNLRICTLSIIRRWPRPLSIGQEVLLRPYLYKAEPTPTPLCKVTVTI